MAGFFDKLAIPAVEDDESIDIDNPSSPLLGHRLSIAEISSH
jgi:hypothetical protein